MNSLDTLQRLCNWHVRGAGNTTAIIHAAALSNAVLIVENSMQRDDVRRMASEQGYGSPKIVTLAECPMALHGLMCPILIDHFALSVLHAEIERDVNQVIRANVILETENSKFKSAIKKHQSKRRRKQKK